MGAASLAQEIPVCWATKNSRRYCTHLYAYISVHKFKYMNNLREKYRCFWQQTVIAFSAPVELGIEAECNGAG
jgi:hypothetical protein